MLTTVLMRRPVWPVHSPDRTRRAKSAILPSTAWTAGTTFSPSTSTTASAGARSAVCSTARPSVTLIFSPRNIASRSSATPVAAARSRSRRRVSSVTNCLEKSTWRSPTRRTYRPARPGSRSNSSRRCTSPSSSRCLPSALHSAIRSSLTRPATFISPSAHPSQRRSQVAPTLVDRRPRAGRGQPTGPGLRSEPRAGYGGGRAARQISPRSLASASARIASPSASLRRSRTYARCVL